MISLKRIGLSFTNRRKFLAIISFRKRQPDRVDWITAQLTSSADDLHVMNNPEIDQVLQHIQADSNVDGLKLVYTFNKQGFTRKTLHLTTRLVDLGFRCFDISASKNKSIVFFPAEITFVFVKESGKLEQQLIQTA